MPAKITAQDAIKQGDVLKSKVAALVASASALQPTDGVVEALKIHAEAVAVREAIEQVTPLVIRIERPVSVADGNTALQIVKDLQRPWNIILDNTIKKKPILDSFPVGNISALVAQDLKLTYQAMLNMANAFVDAAPAELQAEVKSTQKEFEDVMKKAIAVYQ